MSEKAIILDQKAISRSITRIAHEIIERNKGVEDVVLLGVQRRGVPLANRIADKIFEVEGVKVNVGVIDITFYRDDLSLLAEHPVFNGSYIDFSIHDKVVVIVDDVIYTGRTTRATIDSIFDIDRPKAVQLAVLIDRGHRELPIRADFVGKNVPTSKSETIDVNLYEIDGEDNVTIVERG